MKHIAIFLNICECVCYLVLRMCMKKIVFIRKKSCIVRLNNVLRLSHLCENKTHLKNKQITTKTKNLFVKKLKWQNMFSWIEKRKKKFHFYIELKENWCIYLPIFFFPTIPSSFYSENVSMDFHYTSIILTSISF